MIYKGAFAAAANPNYPTANAGDTYIISTGGKVGGASGIDVEIGDMIICNTDSTGTGNQATVGAKWNIIQTNVIGAVTASGTLTTNQLLIGSGGKTASTLAAGTTGNMLVMGAADPT